MKRKLKVAAAVAAAIAVATVAAMLARSTGNERKTAGHHLVGDTVLEMLFCLPGTDCGAK